MILINGSNFIDGLNGLLLGYFLIILFLILLDLGYLIDITNSQYLLFITDLWHCIFVNSKFI